MSFQHFDVLNRLDFKLCSSWKDRVSPSVVGFNKIFQSLVQIFATTLLSCELRSMILNHHLFELILLILLVFLVKSVIVKGNILHHFLFLGFLGFFFGVGFHFFVVLDTQVVSSWLHLVIIVHTRHLEPFDHVYRVFWLHLLLEPKSSIFIALLRVSELIIKSLSLILKIRNYPSENLSLVKSVVISLLRVTLLNWFSIYVRYYFLPLFVKFKRTVVWEVHQFWFGLQRSEWSSITTDLLFLSTAYSLVLVIGSDSLACSHGPLGLAILGSDCPS